MKTKPSPITLDIIERTKRVGARRSSPQGGGSSYMDKLKYISPIITITPQDYPPVLVTYLTTENDIALLTENDDNIII